MKPLNRPMFRMGGPIKEGIMSGMKDNTGTGLVGDKRYPTTDGRSHHFAVAPFIMPALAAAGRFALKPLGKFVTRNVFGKPTVTTGAGGTKTIASNIIGTKNIFQPNIAGRYLLESPEGRLLTGGAGLAGKTGKTIFKGAKSLAKSPLTVAAGLYYGGGALLPDGTPDPNDPKNQKPDGLKRVKTIGAGEGTTGGSVTDDPNKAKQIQEDRIEKTKKRYYELMGLDKMKKDAAYDSLIDASNIVAEEGGDLRGAIKSGTLQNRIIQAISKNLDKSSDIKRQIDAAILKGEIQKDIASADSIDRDLKKARIKQLNRAEKQASASAQIAEVMAKKDGVILGSQTAAILRNDGINYDSVLPDKLFNNFKKDNPGKDEIDFMISEGAGLDDGRYVIGARLVEKKGNEVAFVVQED